MQRKKAVSMDRIDSNKISNLISKSIEFLMIFNKLGTTMGILLGVSIKGMFEIAGKSLNILYPICFCVFAINSPYLFKIKKQYPQEVTDIIAIIEDGLKKGFIDKSHAQLLYKQLSKEFLELAIKSKQHTKMSNE